MAIGDGIKAVAAAATPEALSATQLLVDWVLLSAHEDNTGICAAGTSSAVASATGTARGAIVPEVGTTGLPLLLQGPLDLAEVFIDVATNADSVYFVYRITD